MVLFNTETLSISTNITGLDVQKIANEVIIHAHLNVTAGYIKNQELLTATHSMRTAAETLFSDLSVIDCLDSIRHYGNTFTDKVKGMGELLLESTTPEQKASIYFETLACQINQIVDVLTVQRNILEPSAKSSKVAVELEDLNQILSKTKADLQESNQAHSETKAELEELKQTLSGCVSGKVHESLQDEVKALKAENRKFRKMNPEGLKNSVAKLKSTIAKKNTESKQERAQLIAQTKRGSKFLTTHDQVKSELDDTTYQIVELAYPAENLQTSVENGMIHDLPFSLSVKSSDGISADVHFTRWGTPVYPKTPFFGTGYPTLMNTKLHQKLLELLVSKEYKTERLSLIYSSVKAFGAIEVSELTKDLSIPEGFAKYAASVGAKTLFGVVAMNKSKFANCLSEAFPDVTFEKALDVHAYFVNFSIKIFDKIENQPVEELKSN